MALEEPPQLVALGGSDPDGLPRGIEAVAEPRHPPTNLGWSVVGLPRAAVTGGVDVLHGPAYTGPIWSPVPVVLTIHDVSYARRPEWYPYRQDWLRRMFYRRAALAASHILTVSNFSADEITAAYGIARDRITVASHGVDRSFLPSPHLVSGRPVGGLRPPYLLHVGDVHERRNLGVVLGALLEIRQRVSTLANLSLVVAGVDRGGINALTTTALEAGALEAVIYLGRVSEARLRQLYGGAVALVYPSLYEGFGLPLIEAMASGVPVIASRAAAIPEAVGSAGLLLDPRDADGWRRAIVAVASDSALWARLRSAGLTRAASFTWEQTARATMNVYTRLASR